MAVKVCHIVTRAVCILAAGLAGCGISGREIAGWGAATTCGNPYGGKQTCVNNPSYTCTDCGYRPCVATGMTCYSCASVDGNCYAYDCGTHCSTSPCGSDFSTCGTSGYGDQPCANNPKYICYNCGPAPCVGTNGYCYSCYGADQNCYKYRCSSTHCSNVPCGSAGAKLVLASNATLRSSSDIDRGLPPHWVPKLRPSADVDTPNAPTPPAESPALGSAVMTPTWHAFAELVGDAVPEALAPATSEPPVFLPASLASAAAEKVEPKARAIALRSDEPLSV